MNAERPTHLLSASSPEHALSRREARQEQITFNRYFREKFNRGIRDVEVPGLGRKVKAIDIPSRTQGEGVIKVIVPGWTESVNILKPLMRAWAKQGEHVASYTPGKLINPNRDGCPQVIWDTIAQLHESHAGSEEGRAALASLESHDYFPLHVQRALELLAVINSSDKKVKLHAHSQGLPIATIAALLQPEKIDSIMGDSGAGTIGEDKFSRLAGRFTVHLSGSTLRGFKGPKDAFRTVRGGIGAVKYVGQNRTKALREAGVIASSDVFPALEYLDKQFNIKSALIVPDKDRLYPQNRVEAANSNHAAETGHSVGTYATKGGHNEVYVRAEKHVKFVTDVWKQLS